MKNNMIRMEISPSKEESEGWALEDWKQLAEDLVTFRRDAGGHFPSEFP